MAYSLNRAQLIGNLTRDPEMRQIPGGSTVANFGIATNFTWKDQQGQKQEKTEFHNIVVWGKLAEIAGQYLRKGMKVFIEGRIQTREWQGEDGIKRYRTEIVAENFIMLDRKSGDGMGSGSYAGFEMYDGPSQHAGLKNNPQANYDSPSTNDMASVDSSSNNEDNVPLDDLPF